MALASRTSSPGSSYAPRHSAVGLLRDAGAGAVLDRGQSRAAVERAIYIGDVSAVEVLGRTADQTRVLTKTQRAELRALKQAERAAEREQQLVDAKLVNAVRALPGAAGGARVDAVLMLAPAERSALLLELSKPAPSAQRIALVNTAIAASPPAGAPPGPAPSAAVPAITAAPAGAPAALAAP